jgi:alpha-beta hydrolase superfamily lysophospholipase
MCCGGSLAAPVAPTRWGVKLLIEPYHKAGISSISQDFYPGGRHEMLNEISRGEVQARLLGWISAVLERSDI